MKIKTWPVLAALAQSLETQDARTLSPSVFDAIADRLEAALAAEDNAVLEQISARLEDAVRNWAAAASEDARKALRGDADAKPDLAHLLATGRLAFAQNLAARALDKRAADDFYEVIADRKYQPYICALMSGPKSGVELAGLVNETQETVSRKVQFLEEHDVVRRRKMGQLTVNLLTPGARQYAEAKRLTPAGGAGSVQPAVKTALVEQSGKIEGYLQAARLLGVPHEPAAAS
ncbi:hypothetical protein U0030_02225 [Brevundimonas bullata]|uniref:hypothetical protein n=1 Tax=Brevundimonas bullata TaxID=13160 RepID=UPI0013B42740|nr:hypothetical protein [Brevundimonas bullata]WQE37318.1 hypothetical protein U0030_02225 [Brevundimonas bullata]